MKSRWANSFVIGLLVVSNTVLAAVICLRDPYMRSLWQPTPTQTVRAARTARQAKHAEAPKTASVEGATLSRATALQACYESFLMQKPNSPEGSVTVRWIVDQKGQVASIEGVQSDWEDKSLAECITGQIKQMSFPPAASADGTLMGHKFNFKRRETASIDFQ